MPVGIASRTHRLNLKCLHAESDRHLARHDMIKILFKRKFIHNNQSTVLRSHLQGSAVIRISIRAFNAQNRYSRIKSERCHLQPSIRHIFAVRVNIYQLSSGNLYKLIAFLYGKSILGCERYPVMENRAKARVHYKYSNIFCVKLLL